MVKHGRINNPLIISADSLVQTSNEATLMLGASRCVDLLYNNSADETEQVRDTAARCVLSIRNILKHIQSAGVDFK